MLAHLRITSNHENSHLIHKTIAATVMRDNVRNQRAPLTNVHYRIAEVASVLGEIYAREFTSLMRTLNHANSIAAKYHEAVFDNTDAYIDVGQVDRSPQSGADEMTAEQRHASKLLSSVGTNYSEITMAIQMLGCISIQVPRDVIACNVAVFETLAQHFHSANPSIVEDAFDRLQHIVKQVWTLVNTLAFSNLFRFVDPKHPISIPTSDDAIFVPHIPHIHLKEEDSPRQIQQPPATQSATQSGFECKKCGNSFDPDSQHLTIGQSTTDPTRVYLCQPCEWEREYG